MARPTETERLHSVWYEALTEFDRVYTAAQEERRISVEDRRFVSIPGAQWEGPWGEMFENKPRPEVNKVQNALIRVENEYRNNRITVDFKPKDGISNMELADTCDGLYRSDEQDSGADEAYDNAFQEGIAGGFGAWRLRACYEDEEDDENEYQRIRFEPIFDADTSVYFDIDAKRQSKSDAKRAWVIYGMTPEAYEAEFDSDPDSWPKDEWTTEFDWDTPDIVYVAEYYRIEEKRITVRTFQGVEEEKKLTDDELEEMGEKLAEEAGAAPDASETLKRRDLIDMAIADLAGIGFMEIKKRTRKTCRVRKYLLSGERVLEDQGFIAGRHIPIIPFYGKRWFVDNIERFSGVVRLAKDCQRLKNMLIAWLAEIAATSSIEKPIFTPEQVAGHENMWAEDNVVKYPYQLINPLTTAEGQEVPSGPLGYTKAPEIPQAIAALMQIVDIDMKEILGNNDSAQELMSNISGKAVELVQQRIDMMAFIYMSNFAKSMQWCGEVWLSMAKEIYHEEDRRMKTIGEMGNTESIVMGEPIVEGGELTTRNDLSKAEFDVVSTVGPSFNSRRDATVRSLTAQLQMTTDEQDKKILNSLILMNTDGEGLQDVREYYRKQLVAAGVLQPNEEEKKAMEEAAANEQPNPQDQYLLSEAAANEALIAERGANTQLKAAQTEETKAKTARTGAETIQILGEVGAPATP
jgi:hypothetical protein